METDMTREEAIRRIKSWDLDFDDMEVLAVAIPELRESEDEKIRKAVLKGIEYLEMDEGWDSIGDIDILDAKQWLEKQKESLHITEMCKENAGSFTDEDEDRTINGCLLAANAERRCKRVSEELLEELGLADYTQFFYEQGVEKGKKEREKQKEQNHDDSIRTKIVSRAKSEKQVVLVSESDGFAEIGWDTRSLEDTKDLLEYGLAFISGQLEKQK